MFGPLIRFEFHLNKMKIIHLLKNLISISLYNVDLIHCSHYLNIQHLHSICLLQITNEINGNNGILLIKLTP